jgi:hypothetical protein
MSPATISLDTYRELADWYERLGQTTMRDRFLMLAADAAMQAGHPEEAERYRQRLLSGSRHHMLRPYGSWAEASAAPDVQAYLRDLRLNYPPEVAQKLLAGLKQGGGGAAPPRAAGSGIPFTAPFVDVTGPGPGLPRTRLDETYPIAGDTPGAQPAPRPGPWKPAPRPEGSKPKLPVEEKKRPPRAPRNKARWFSAVLCALAFLTALAAAALTLGRPFFPGHWIR